MWKKFFCLGGKHIPGGVFSIVALVLLCNVQNSVKCFVPRNRRSIEVKRVLDLPEQERVSPRSCRVYPYVDMCVNKNRFYSDTVSLNIALTRHRIRVMTQLLLSLKTPPRYTFDSLVPHEGIEQAVSTLLSVYGDPAHALPGLFLYGPSGTGKTHLLHAAAALAAHTRGKTESTVRFISGSGDSTTFSGLEELVSGPDDTQHEVSCVAVDDVHMLSVDRWTQLWSLWNKTSRWGCPLMMASQTPPAEIFQDDPHLVTRVTSGLVFRLDPPEDPMRLLILDKMARDRHVHISRDVCNYLVTRKSRNVKELERILDMLDQASLELKRRITLPLIKILEHEGAM